MNSPSPETTGSRSEIEPGAASGADRPDGGLHGGLLAFALRVLIACGVVLVVAAVAAAVVVAPELPLLVFLAILGAVFLDAASRPLRWWLRLPQALAVVVVTLFLVTAVAAVAAVWGPAIVEDGVGLVERMPKAFERAEEYLRERDWGHSLLETTSDGWDAGRFQQVISSLWSSLAGAFTATLAALSAVLIVVAVAVFLAMQPGPYRRGLVHMTAPRSHQRMIQVLDDLAHTLRWWLLGRLSSMAAVGILTAVGLLLIGVPHAILLGAMAGAFSFIPYLGPVLSVIPALLVSLAEQPELALWILALYAAVQLVEGYLLTPLILAHTVSLPPGILIVSQLALGLFCGFLGVLVAAPLVVVVIVLIQSLYVRQVLGDPVQLLGSSDDGRQG